MNGVRQAWLVAVREMRERSRSRAFRISVVLMIVAVVAVLVLPTLLKPGGGTKDVGLAGPAPAGLAAMIREQAHAAGTTARVHHYASLAAGEQAVRQGHLDVLVVGARRLEWQTQADTQLQAAITGGIQLATVRERANAAGIKPGALTALLAPVPVTSIQLGPVPGSSPGDETAVFIMTAGLFFSISVFGQMVLTGVLEEKASRVFEVILARIPARTLLAGKVAGIGLLGLAQTGLAALAALITVTAAGSVNVPAVRGGVLAWVLVWFVLGYLLYATLYGALGSLGSRVEDAQTVAGPVMIVMVLGYFASFTMIGHPASAPARALSFFPLTAPMAMPGRVAMGAAPWWEPVAAAALALAATAALVQFAGRLYTRAILHGGPRLSLRDAWRSATTPEPSATRAGARDNAWPRKARAMITRRAAMTSTEPANHRLLITVLTGIGVVLGAVVAVVTSDVILGVIAGAGFIAIAVQMVKLWTGRSGPPLSHR
jgi:ABC-2 type transport system permease protein